MYISCTVHNGQNTSKAIPSFLGILVYSDLTSIVTINELGGTAKLSILFMKSFVSLDVADDDQQNVKSQRYGN